MLQSYPEASLPSCFLNAVQKDAACSLQLPDAASSHGAGRIQEKDGIQWHLQFARLDGVFFSLLLVFMRALQKYFQTVSLAHARLLRPRSLNNCRCRIIVCAALGARARPCSGSVGVTAHAPKLRIDLTSYIIQIITHVGSP